MPVVAINPLLVSGRSSFAIRSGYGITKLQNQKSQVINIPRLDLHFPHPYPQHSRQLTERASNGRGLDALWIANVDR
jgi:hypothetical protein